MTTAVQAGAAAAAALVLLLWKLRHSVQCYWFDRTYSPPHDPSRADRVAVVTGGNRGLGLATCHLLAEAGYGTVVVACRDVGGSGKRAAEDIRTRHPNSAVEVMELDLSTIGGADKFADEFLRRHGRLDALVCNSGIGAVPQGLPEVSPDTGGDAVFQVNYLGHYRLWGRFKSVLTSTAKKSVAGAPPSNVGPRVVSVSSGASKRAEISWDGTQKSSFKYGQSKLAQIMASKHTQRSVPEGTDLKFVSVTPGAVRTDMLTRNLSSAALWQRSLVALFNPILWFLLRSPRMGAQTIAMAVLDPGIVGGGYYSNCLEKESEGKNGMSNDPDAQERLIQLSDELISRVAKKTT